MSKTVIQKKTDYRSSLRGLRRPLGGGLGHPLSPSLVTSLGARTCDRDAEGIEGEGNGEGVRVPLPSRLGGLGSVVNSPGGIRGGASPENGFWCILSFKNPCLDKKI